MKFLEKDSFHKKISYLKYDKFFIQRGFIFIYDKSELSFQTL